MSPEPSPEMPTVFQPLLERLQTLSQQQAWPKAMLLINPERQPTEALLLRIQTSYLCESEDPCGHCIHCRLLHEGQHPDVDWLVGESPTDPIKIDVIRALQETAYLPPQMAKKRLVVIRSLERFTVAAANAFLKLLEEPPQALHFIAVTAYLNDLLPTIVSRFQRWTLPGRLQHADSYITPEVFSEEAALALLHAHAQLWAAWEQVCSGQLSVVGLAEAWSVYPLQTLYQVLYCLWAEQVRLHSAGRRHALAALRVLMEAIQQLKTCANANPLLQLEQTLYGLYHATH